MIASQRKGLVFRDRFSDEAFNHESIPPRKDDRYSCPAQHSGQNRLRLTLNGMLNL